MKRKRKILILITSLRLSLLIITKKWKKKSYFFYWAVNIIAWFSEMKNQVKRHSIKHENHALHMKAQNYSRLPVKDGPNLNRHVNYWSNSVWRRFEPPPYIGNSSCYKKILIPRSMIFQKSQPLKWGGIGGGGGSHYA